MSYTEKRLHEEADRLAQMLYHYLKLVGLIGVEEWELKDQLLAFANAIVRHALEG